MKILLLGKGGQVGWELQRSLAVAGEVVALDFDDGGDFTQPESLLATVQGIAPQVIVNAAAHTAVDKAESEPDLARQINATTPALLAIEAKRLGALFVHYSTDYVFDGSGDQPRDEEAPIAPLSVYGATKAEGEDAIRASGCQHLILRTSWVYAARGGNFAKTMLRLAAEREQLKVIADQIGAPTGAELLADLTAHMLRAARANPALTGTYHAVAGGETNWHDYARFVIEFARQQGKVIKVAPEQILAIPTSDYPTPAKRPLNSRLSTAKLQQRFGLQLPSWQQGVQRMLSEIL
ncbi:MULTISPECIES: dTDP-4-dehydrorhamnose reductase [unclassified Roseateles]|uniref:dTDP-4-dehydrorhamnose reductase n=1 Tax=unclassified Roseateles TaxID=2626991 RepID=UPI0006FE1792|nr:MULTISPECIES: dTDP-4-dehydrorhamnose reductase [unclassified Roseateles]KQW41964.1 dTDP-4-dehydrorhamnose reductase [Pelomonas sp. Root405]KRA67567.1 dTDP-4-dehydrorhamnose reductase [Pelomonas sp. Root662]